MTASKIIPTLWYAEKVEEAVKLYVSLFPNSRIDSTSAMLADTPGGPEGSVKIVEFTLLGQPFMAFSAKPMGEFNYSVSFTVPCDTQEEIDKYSDALIQGGGSQEPCGWVKDRFGLSWQIVPANLGDLMKGSDRAKAKRVTEAMLKMTRLNKAALEKA